MNGAIPAYTVRGINMELETILEAKAFIFFLSQERVRHMDDIAQIDAKIKKVTNDWDFWVE